MAQATMGPSVLRGGGSFMLQAQSPKNDYAMGAGLKVTLIAITSFSPAVMGVEKRVKYFTDF